jgi:hypothetical protein
MFFFCSFIPFERSAARETSAQKIMEKRPSDSSNLRNEHYHIGIRNVFHFLTPARVWQRFIVRMFYYHIGSEHLHVDRHLPIMLLRDMAFTVSMVFLATIPINVFLQPRVVEGLVFLQPRHVCFLYQFC